MTDLIDTLDTIEPEKKIDFIDTLPTPKIVELYSKEVFEPFEVENE